MNSAARVLLLGVALAATKFSVAHREGGPTHPSPSGAILQTQGLFATTRIRIAAPPLDAVEERPIAELVRHTVALAKAPPLAGIVFAIARGRTLPGSLRFSFSRPRGIPTSPKPERCNGRWSPLSPTG